MDLKKIIRGRYESLFYCSAGDIVNQKNCVLLGYKDGIPVLSKEISTVAKNPPASPPTKHTLRVEVDVMTGVKYINLNGKKLRMVPESDLPPHLKQTAQVIKAPGTFPSEKKPVKIKILGSIPHIIQGPMRLVKNNADTTSLKTNVNKTDNGTNVQLSHKTVVIRDRHPILTKIPSTDKLAITESSSTTGSTSNGVGKDSAGLISENDRHLKANIVSYSGGDFKSLNGVLKMNPLDLSTVSNKVGTIKAEVKKFDKCTQTSVDTVDACVETDPDDFLLNFINMDFVELLNSAVPPVDPVRPASPKIAPKASTEVHNEKFKMFFQDLRAAKVPDMNGNMPVHVGVLKNDVCYVKRCCAVLNALQTSVDIPNHGDMTALQLAIINDVNPQIVKVLLANGASLGSVDSEGNNVIHLAVECKRTEMLDIILRFADERKFDLNDFNAEGLTPLMIACCNKLVECTDLLLKYDADINVRDRKSGRTALFHAAENNSFELVQLLLNNNADTKIKNFFGTSPHDAMYEVDEIPETIKTVILGKSAKRKTTEEPKVLKVRRVEENLNKLKTYARFRKVEYDLPANFATKA